MRKPTEDFYEAVYALVQCIPRGRVSSYGAIAAALGQPSAARTVGYALTASNRNPHADVPAHRVVNRKGLLTGKVHFGTPTRMQELLEAEGVEVVDDQVQDFEQRFWDPLKELS